MNSTDAPRLEHDTELLACAMAVGAQSYPALAAHFGVLGNPHEADFLTLLESLHSTNGDEVGRILHALARHEELLPCVDRVAQFLYKVQTRLPLQQVISMGQHLVSGVLRGHPGNLDAEHLALEFMLYFGLLDSTVQLLDMLPADRHMAHRGLLRRALTRRDGFSPRTRVSYCILTWNRADLLDRCLTDLKAKAFGRDYEILVGVNASTDHTAQVLERHGVERVFWNVRNDSIDYYREIMDAARGEYLIEVDDNVVDFPEAFDELLINHLQAFPDFSYLGFEPTRLSLATGQSATMTVGDDAYLTVDEGVLRVFLGPVWGCCAILSNRDYRLVNGLYGARLSKQVGEEPQFIRKLLAHQRKSGLLRGHRLVKAYP